MKNWQILSFKHKTQDLILNRNGDNENVYSGFKPAMPAVITSLNGMEFICNPNYRVWSIRRNAIPGTTEEVFTVGDVVISNAPDGNSPIHTIKLIDTNIVQFILGNAQTVDMSLAIKWVKPAPVVLDPAVVFKQIETKIMQDNPKPIRLRATKKNRGNQTVDAFLIRFFEDYNKERETIYVEDEKVQTDTNGGEGRRRSLGDIYQLTRYYFPNVTLKEVLKHLYKTLPAHFGPAAGFRCCACKQINKRVWYLDPAKGQTAILDEKKVDEFGYLPEAVKQLV